MPTDQALSAQRIYNPRAATYDNSFHPTLAADYISWARPQPGQRVLDLACGTGLVTLLAKQAVGSTGSVTGIDVSDDMMEVGRSKAAAQGVEVEFIHHDITDLKGEGRIGDEYDLITCASSLVLLEDPVGAIGQWAGLLRPGGRLITDALTETSQLQGLFFEEVSKELGVKAPFHRSWVKGIGSLQELMLVSGLEIERAWTSSQYGQPTELRAEAAEELFERQVPGGDEGVERDERDRAIGRFLTGLGTPGVREKAKQRFVQKMRNAAGEDGVIPSPDLLYIVIGRKK